MDKFLDSYILPRMYQEDIDKLNRSIASNATVAEIKSSITEKECFTTEFLQNIQRITPTLFRLFQNIEQEWNSATLFLWD